MFWIWFLLATSQCALLYILARRGESMPQRIQDAAEANRAVPEDKWPSVGLIVPVAGRDPRMDAVACEAARRRTADLRRHPCLRRLHLRHRRHRGIPRRAQGPRHLAAGRLQLVPYAAHLLGHTGDHRHHLRAHVPSEPERAYAARPCQR